MNSKGFNLFTALVSAVILMSGVVLAATLVSTEEKIGNELYFMFNNYQLSDAAAIAKSDAIQTFNHILRAKMEEHLSYDSASKAESKGWTILTTENYDDWPALVERFKNRILLVDPAATGPDTFKSVINYVAKKTIDNFTEYSGGSGRYSVTLNDKSVDSSPNSAVSRLENALVEAVQGADILEVVGCNPDVDNCPIGSFYLNIPLNKISPLTYEALPRIIVKDIITNEEIKIGILPRTNLRIYIPTRYFKVIFMARKNAEAMKNAEPNLERALLGFCDSGSCVPRTDPLSSTSGSWDGYECAGSSLSQTLTGSPAGMNSYLVQSNSTIGTHGLTAYAKQLICNNAPSVGAGYSSDPEFYNPNLTSGLAGDLYSNTILGCPFKKINVSTEGSKSKIINGTPTGSAELYCGQIRSVNADVDLIEKNNLYIVSGDKRTYRINISTGSFAKRSETSEICNNSGTPPKCSP